MIISNILHLANKFKKMSLCTCKISIALIKLNFKHKTFNKIKPINRKMFPQTNSRFFLFAMFIDQIFQNQSQIIFL